MRKLRQRQWDLLLAKACWFPGAREGASKTSPNICCHLILKLLLLQQTVQWGARWDPALTLSSTSLALLLKTSCEVYLGTGGKRLSFLSLVLRVVIFNVGEKTAEKTVLFQTITARSIVIHLLTSSISNLKVEFSPKEEKQIGLLKKIYRIFELWNFIVEFLNLSMFLVWVWKTVLNFVYAFFLFYFSSIA